MKTLATALLLLTLLIAATAAGGYFYLRHRADSFSARSQPTRLEAALARAARNAATPETTKSKQNPINDTPQVFEEGMAHYADHCAVCHGNDGSGDTMFGRGMYPKPPDLRAAATQNLTDGELFSILENGVRLTGMPAFGTPNDDGTDSWKLVRFLRHLPTLTPDQLQIMATLNPKSPDELEEEKQEQQFLNGK